MKGISTSKAKQYIGVRKWTSWKNKPIHLGRMKFPELAGTMFVVVLGRFFTGLSTMNYGRSLGGNTAGREIGQVAIACVQHIG